MTFEIVKINGEPAIIGHGEIVIGDADRLLKVLIPSAKHSRGYFPLVLISPGGSVAAAFEVSRVIDKFPVFTYVPPGAECVSACAAIEFISGQEHLAIGNGKLGFHGCYNAATKEIISDCNEAIAQHSVNHGTAYGSVMAFIQHVPANEVIWIDGQQADCWAINRYTFSPQPEGYESCVFAAIRSGVPPKKQ